MSILYATNKTISHTDAPLGRGCLYSAQHCCCISSLDCDGKALQEDHSAARFSDRLAKALTKLLDEIHSSLTKYTRCLQCKMNKVMASFKDCVLGAEEEGGGGGGMCKKKTEDFEVLSFVLGMCSLAFKVSLQRGCSIFNPS